MLSFKPGSHITVMVPAVPGAVSKAEYDYGTCALSQVPQAEFSLVPGTADRVQSCPRYRRYRTVRQKESDFVTENAVTFRSWQYKFQM